MHTLCMHRLYEFQLAKNVYVYSGGSKNFTLWDQYNKKIKELR